MHPVLNQNIFLVKELVGLFKASSNFDIFNPDTQQVMLHCREENLNFFTKLFRFTDYKKMTPFEIAIKTPGGERVLTVRRGLTFFRSIVEVLDEKGIVVGKFRQRLLSIGGKFEVLDASDRLLCMLKGKWTSWDFRFVSADNKEFASVSKKWAGLTKEFFTSADTYVLQVNKEVPVGHPLRILILAAVMCIDFVLKE